MFGDDRVPPDVGRPVLETPASPAGVSFFRKRPSAVTPRLAALRRRGRRPVWIKPEFPQLARPYACPQALFSPYRVEHRVPRTCPEEGDTEWPAAARPGKSRISSRSRRA